MILGLSILLMASRLPPPQPFGKSPPAPHTALATSLATSGVPSENQSPWEPPAGKMETWNGGHIIYPLVI